MLGIRDIFSINKLKLIILSIFLVVTLAALHVDSSVEEQNGEGLVEDHEVYENNVIGSIKEVYITILPPFDVSNKYSYTFKQLNEDEDYKDSEDVEIKVLFQEGENGSPKQGYFGYGLTDTNAVMSLRGHSTRGAKLKSYKIDLNKAGGLWRGFEVINLNKHPFDSIKIRNKLSFDYLKNIPEITSLRTNFVHLYIKDYSEGDFQQGFKDYGLYTQVENVDTEFLKNHGLDPKGYLYKAENFEFFRYPEQLMIKEKKAYREKDFEEILEVKGNDEHKKLLEMLEDVNNDFIHINDVFNEHFDKDNYLTWLGVNILLGNIDTNSQNFYLYSPRKSNKWYFLPWDYDGAWGYYDQPGRSKAPWQEGVSNYWGNVLHKRFLKNHDNLEALSQKIEYLAKQFNSKKTEELLDEYKPIVEPLLISEPDNKYNWAEKDVLEEFKQLPKIIERNRQKYYHNLQKPLPIHMGRPSDLGTYYVFTWTESYDFQGDTITYSVDISDNPDFKDVIYHRSGIRDTECVVNNLRPGKYYWKLTIEDSEGNQQTAFDVLHDVNSEEYYGVQQFFVQ